MLTFILQVSVNFIVFYATSATFREEVARQACSAQQNTITALTTFLRRTKQAFKRSSSVQVPEDSD